MPITYNKKQLQSSVSVVYFFQPLMRPVSFFPDSGSQYSVAGDEEYHSQGEPEYARFALRPGVSLRGRRGGDCGPGKLWTVGSKKLPDSEIA